MFRVLCLGFVCFCVFCIFGQSFEARENPIFTTPIQKKTRPSSLEGGKEKAERERENVVGRGGGGGGRRRREQ